MEKGFLLPAGEFEARWREQGEQQGEEHEVYSTENGKTVVKRNNLGYHASNLEYFERLALQNYLFPAAKTHFLGFDDSAGYFKPVTSQPVIKAERGATEAEVRDYMTRLGFRPYDEHGLNWYDASTGIVVEDLHDQNAVIDHKGRLVVFDPVIYPKPTERLIRQTLRPRGLLDEAEGVG